VDFPNSTLFSPNLFYIKTDIEGFSPPIPICFSSQSLPPPYGGSSTPYPPLTSPQCMFLNNTGLGRTLIGGWVEPSKFSSPLRAPRHWVYSWVVHAIHHIQAHRTLTPTNPYVVASRGSVAPHRWVFCPRNHGWMSTMPLSLASHMSEYMVRWWHVSQVLLPTRNTWQGSPMPGEPWSTMGQRPLEGCEEFLIHGRDGVLWHEAVPR
jgi:hypothetical protein